MAIKFLTERDIEESASQGVTEILLDPHIRVTDLARETAQRLGVKLVSMGEPTASSLSAPATASDLHDQVRAAVISQLGMEPDGLDAVIDRVLGSTEDAG